MPEERKLAAAVIYNRLKAGDTLGIDATIRYYLRNYDEQLTESELADTNDPYNTRVIPGPAADADREPGARLDRGGRQPGQVRRLSTSSSSPAPAASTSSSGPRRSSSRPRRPTSRRCRNRAARRPTAERGLGSGDAPSRRPRPSGRPLALARDAQRGARRARAWRASGPTRRSRSSPSTSRPWSRRFPTTTSPASTSPCRTSSRRSSSPTRPPPPRARSAPRTRSASTPGPGQRRQHRRRRDHRRRSAPRSRDAGARARRRRLGSRGDLGAAQRRRARSRSGTALQQKAESLAAEFDVVAEQRAASDEQPEIGKADLVVNATTLGLAQASSHPPTPSDLKQLPFDADAVNASQIVVDLVYGSYETALASRARERGARVIDGLEVLVHQGAASLRIWTGREPPIEIMRRAAREQGTDGRPPRIPSPRPDTG